MNNTQDIKFQIFGRLKPIERVMSTTKGGRKVYKWRCVCDCGNETQVVISDLKRGKTKSCGCLNREIVSKTSMKHGMSKTIEFNIWRGIKQRCNNKKCSTYKYYGNLGVKICDRWLNSFENFYKDMGDIPSKNHSIDRIDVNGDYSPENCRWSDSKTQSRNKKFNHNVTFNNETMCIAAWAEKLSIKYSTLSDRILRGWTIEKALTTPVKHKS